MLPLPRRQFLQTAASLAAFGATTSASAAPHNELVVAVIGNGGQGKGHLNVYNSLPNVKVGYVCDVDEGRLDAARKICPQAKAVSDFRKILDDPVVDAVTIATPDHWHTPAALLALQAGKHVYVEKPCSHNVREGRWLVEAATRTGKVVQHGTQSRSNTFLQAAIQHLRDGVIGRVVVAKAWDVQFREPIGKAKPGTPPGGFDYDTWVGPAEMVPFQSNRHHYSWHWWRNFGTGDAGNDGVHEIDIARWGLGVETHPERVIALGGKYVHDDDQEFPDTMTAAFEYPQEASGASPLQLVFELRLWSRNYPYNMDNGNEFLGTKGRMVLTKRGKMEAFDDKGTRIELKMPEEVKPPALKLHQQNFLNAIRTGQKLAAPVLTGHLSASLPHLANMACFLKRGLTFDGRTEQIVGDSAANDLLGRTYRAGHWGTPPQGRT